MASSRTHRLSEFCKEHYLEVMLTMTVFGCSMLLTMLPSAKVAVLNLYFLPIVLAGFFLGAIGPGLWLFCRRLRQRCSSPGK